MSQFGTIGTLYPSCTGHPSCSQFKARDIIFRYEPKTTGRLDVSTFSTDLAPNNNVDGKNGMISSSTNNMENVMKIVGMNIHGSDGTITEEVTRKYVEVTTGVWSYMN